MKVENHGIYNLLHYTNSDKIKEKPALIKDVVPELADKTITVSISEEGLEAYRKHLKESNVNQAGSLDDIVRLKEFFRAVGDTTPDLNYTRQLRSRVSRLNEQDWENGTGSTWQNRAENVMAAYASFYDEIVQGYADGSRIINVVDSFEDLTYHSLTMEDELRKLEAAYQDVANDFEEVAEAHKNQQEFFYQITYKKLYRYIGSSGALMSEEDYIKDQKEREEKVPFNLAQKLISVKDAWKNTYLQSTKESAWKSAASMIKDMFENAKGEVEQPRLPNDPSIKYKKSLNRRA